MGIKRVAGVLMSLMFVLLISGCAGRVDVNQLEPGIDNVRISNVGVSAMVQEVYKEEGDVYIDVMYVNNSERDLVYGLEPCLEIKKDGQWYAIAVSEDATWEAIGVVLISGNTSQETVNLTEYYGDLPSGHYRYLKRIDSFYRAAEFDL